MLKEKYSDKVYIDMNITDKTLKVYSEMFIYLYSCPEHVKASYLLFYNLFQHLPPSDIILTLNRMRKGIQKYKYFQFLIEKLFKRTTKLFSLKYPGIQNLLPGVARNASLKGYNNISLDSFNRKGICKCS